MEEDKILVRRVLKGDIESFEDIIKKYEYSILKFVYNIIKNKQEAEDITQEVFITIYNKIYMYNEKYKFYNWILQIAKNKCIDHIRKYRKVYNTDIDEKRNIKSNDVSPEEFIEYKETKKVLIELLNNLEYTDKEIVVLKYSQGLTFKDIAQVLNINESLVKRRYYKSKSYIINKVRERCE